MRSILLILLVLPIYAFSFQEHARVYFKDKENVSASIANPGTILTQRTIDRKKKFNVPVDERDVPVNEAYISGIKTQPGILVKAKSKWFNCVHVFGSVADINALRSIDYVSEIIFSDNQFNISSKVEAEKKTKPVHKDKFENEVPFDYGSTTNQIKQLNLDDLHNKGYTGKGYWIAVMDAGFPNVNTMTAFSRLRDNNNFLGGYDFVNKTNNIFAYTGNSHGTKVLSTMTGYVDGQYVGTAPDASYFLFRTEEAEQETPFEESYWVEAAERADSLGVDVINTSLGYSIFDDADYNYTTQEMDGNTAFISKGATIATEKGLLVVNSAGNEGNDQNWGIITAPADANVLTVGAVNASGQYVTFSSRGPASDGRVKPDVMAQGAGTAVIGPDNQIVTSNGTSFSSPVMAGAVACLWQAFPDKSNVEIMQMIRESAHLYTNPDNLYGYGIPDFGSSIGSEANNSDPDIEESTDFRIFPNPTTGKFEVNFPVNTTSATLDIFDILGKRIYSKLITSNSRMVNISHLNSGIYIATITSKNTKNTLKIVKQ